MMVRSTGAYKRLSGLSAGPVLRWVDLNTTPARLFGLDSENLSHGSPSSFG